VFDQDGFAPVSGGCEVHQVVVELLRRGPQHNQFLSPLTDYLAVCGDSPACTVQVPWEHSRLLRLLGELRYDVASATPTDRPAGARDEAGEELAKMLASISGLAGSLTNVPGVGEVTHLRIVISASELALLPLELCRNLDSDRQPGVGFMSLQGDRLVCLTRRVRSVRSPIETWSNYPKILFVSGPDVPFERHLDALLRVVEPWRKEPLVSDPDNPRLSRCDVLSVLRDGTVEDLKRVAASEEFTHVHILAHGDVIDDGSTTRYGIALGDRVVRGEDLATALSGIGGRRGRLPSVVTLASCDSAAQGSVMTPGGSIAHALHSEGIGLVLASQFPLSADASVPFVEVFYAGQLRGDHPLESVCDLRRELATSFPDEHAWGSVVVYEALPSGFETFLEQLRYWQSRRASEKALRHFEALATSDEERTANLESTGRPFSDDFSSPSTNEYQQRLDAAMAARSQLPSAGAYGAEGNGLRAAALKRTAEVAFWLSMAADASPERRSELHGLVVVTLQHSLDLYTSTMNTLLADNREQVHEKVTYHWIIGQVLVLRAILGIERPDNDELRGTARLTARLDLDNLDADVRAWAIVSLIELALCELVTSTKRPPRAVAAEAVRHAQEIVGLLGYGAEHVELTRRQMRRYATWWGTPDFEEALRACGLGRKASWDGRQVLRTATEVVQAFTAAGSAPKARTSLAVAATPRTATAVSAPQAPPAAHAGTFDVEMLAARNGDCLWITYGTDPDALHHMMVDCGSRSLASTVADRIRSVPRLALFVLSHIDADHINGAIELLADDGVRARIDDVWFNGWNQLRGFLGVRQGEQFSALLDRFDRPFLWNTARAGEPPPPIEVGAGGLPEMTLDGGMRLTVLSPTGAGLRRLARDWNAALRELDPAKAMLGGRARPAPLSEPARLDLEALAASGPTRDSSVPNLSSIALLAEFGGRAVVLAADAHADILSGSIRALQKQRGHDVQPLRLDALKLSHHGSANATTKDLLGLLDCDRYLVSTDGSGYFHPDGAAIARVITRGGPGVALYFNYRSEFSGLWDDDALRQRYGYSTHYPEDNTSGLRITL